MNATKAKARAIVWIRRAVQTSFLVLFVALVLATRPVGDRIPGEGVRYFFLFDPLIVGATWLAAHAVPVAGALALVTLAVTMLFGRVFCGWICPLGTLHAAVGGVADTVRKSPPSKDRWSPWQRSKYYLLVVLVVLALCGVHWIGVFDPLSLTYRSLSTVVVPGLQYGVETASTAVYQADPHLGPAHLTSVTEPVYRFFRDRVFAAPRQAFEGSVLLAISFVGILLLNLYRRRFWCRYACPLGALLGLFARSPMLRLKQDEKACSQCGKCAGYCQGAANADSPGKWLPQECFGCWNCVGTCGYKAIDFKFTLPFMPGKQSGSLDLGRRAVLGAGIGGVAGVLLFRLTPQAQARTFNPGLIRPPGAHAEPDFLQRCIQCGLCMKVCPTNGLQPTLFEAGLEGVWTPRLVPVLGYCTYDCTACGDVCPTGAIEQLVLEKKKEVKIGLATIDTTRCLPYAYARNCIVCEEHCPIPKKAITFVETAVPLRDGGTRVVKQPKVDPDLCIGCGICENKCVFKDRPAIRVTSANESRHPMNQPILPGSDQQGGEDEGAYGY